MRNPIQPLALDDRGVLRFKENAIVNYLREVAKKHGVDMNEMITMGFSVEDWQQYAQLTGYSLSGYSELPYVDDASYEAAHAMASDPSLREEVARISTLEAKIESLKNAMREPIADLFGVPPDDLH